MVINCNVSIAKTTSIAISRTLIFELFFLKIALFKELVDSPQKRTEKTEEVSMIYL